MTMMQQPFRLLLILLGMSALLGKYIYIEKTVTWHEAQYYCREFHTDLAPISGNYDRQSIQKLTTALDYFWIGLERNTTDRDKWMWSGGGEASNFYWGSWEPQDHSEKDHVMMHCSLWYSVPGDWTMPFFCYSVHVVREKKTWEEALEYCREHHHDLASVTSETEMMLIQRELNKKDTTEHVWMGLRFLAGSWMWTDGRQLSYKAWDQQGQPSCPEIDLRCGALQVVGGMQDNNSTATTTASNATQTPQIFYASHVQRESNILLESAAAEGVNEWQTRNCEEKLHFICY